MSQHRRATSSEHVSAGHLHQESGDSQMRVLEREDRWFGRRVSESHPRSAEKPPLNRGGVLRHLLLPHIWRSFTLWGRIPNKTF